MTRFILVICIFLFAAVLVCSTGCDSQIAGPQAIELELDPDDVRTFLVDPSKSEHGVLVVAKSDGPPIKAFVYLSEDDEVVSRALMFGQSTDKIIASQSDTAQISLTAKIPADKEASIRLQTASPQKAKVTLTITN